MSQYLRSSGVTSPWIWGPGCSVGRRSQDIASCPALIKASRTMPENSQAIRILIVYLGISGGVGNGSGVGIKFWMYAELFW